MLRKTFSSLGIEAGCDEAGRGCLAGPVFAAAVILPIDFDNSLINDSKKLSSIQRETLREIIENNATDWAVAKVDPLEIDKINILNASILAMHKALNKLNVKPEFIIIDGNRFKPYNDIPYKCIIKGDALYMSIASASILAKTYRDDFMTKIYEEYPLYGWNKNKGYPTKAHRMAIINNGLTPWHRRSFNCNLQLKIDF